MIGSTFSSLKLYMMGGWWWKVWVNKKQVNKVQANKVGLSRIRPTKLTSSWLVCYRINLCLLVNI